MDKETYNRAVVISNRLSQPQKVKDEIQNTSNHYLTYAEKGCAFSDLDSLCIDYIMKYISDILDKHDKMIREEIDDEIASLNKEIEEL